MVVIKLATASRIALRDWLSSGPTIFAIYAHIGISFLNIIYKMFEGVMFSVLLKYNKEPH